MSTRKTLLEEIFEELFRNIEKQKEFDSETIDNLKKLASSGEIKKPDRLLKVITTSPGGKE